MKIIIDKSNIKDKGFCSEYGKLIIQEQEIIESIILKNNITAHARLMYIYLLKTFDNITMENLSKNFNKTKYTIITYFTELKKSNLIEIVKTNNKQFTISLKIPEELLEEYKTIDEKMKDIEKYFEF